jgi:hypothetical protein
MTDKLMGAAMFDLQKSDREKPAGRRDSLYSPLADGRERGGYPGHVAESSVYTTASVHPLITGSLLAGLGFAAFMAWRSLSEQRNGRSSSYAAE